MAFGLYDLHDFGYGNLRKLIYDNDAAEYTILKSGYLNPSSSILCLMIMIIAVAVYPVCLKVLVE